MTTKSESEEEQPAIAGDKDKALKQFNQRLADSLDVNRADEVAARRQKGYRTARENLEDLCDKDSFIEYGQLAVAAQRKRLSKESLNKKTPADGVITGLARVNSSDFGATRSQVAVVVNDYSVLAGTQGYFHHKKLDRIIAVAMEQRLPVIMFTEGGGGRPGDTDVLVNAAGLELKTFASWAAMSGVAPRIAVNNGYCFAGNAALFGSADITIATKSSWIGMAGPAMIEGGGMGKYQAEEIGPTDVQANNGVIDLVAEDEADATRLAQKVLSYFQGDLASWKCADQNDLWSILPKDRRFAYDVRKIITTLADTDSFTELRPTYGRCIITGFIRIEGKPFGILCNDCRMLGGAIDSESSIKAARFIELCDRFGIGMVSLCDTPGFMVGPESEVDGAVRKMSELFLAGARARIPVVSIVLRKAYGLGAMAMVMGSFFRPVFSASWPSGEFGGMGLEGAVNLGFKKELDKAANPQQRKALFEKLVGDLYELGKATEVASYVEFDAVIMPERTREVILQAMAAAKQTPL